MPIYEYQCSSCNQRTEAIQRLDEPPLAICPHCGGPLVKLMSAPSFQFKGSGWYVTDYGSGKSGGKGGDGKAEKAGEDAPEKPPASSVSESKKSGSSATASGKKSGSESSSS